MTLDQQYRNVLILLAVVIVAGSGYWLLRHFRPSLFLGEPSLVIPIEETDLPSPSETVKSAPKPPEIVVHVAGAVQSPGVYRLSPEARVIDAIEKGGGATADADIHRLNLAQKIRDGQQIYVPETPQSADTPHVDPPIRSVPTPQSVTRVLPSMDRPLINLNTATSQQLQTLPRIGPATAKRIIEYRETSGRFSSVEDLANVKGIGQKTLERIRHRVVVY